MAQKKYANSKNPLFMTWAGPGIALLGVIIYIVAVSSDNDVWATIGISAYIIFYGLGFYFIRKACFCVIDEEQRIIFSQDNKKHPMKIDEIEYVMYKESKKGRFRSLFIHDTGVGFFNIKVNKKKADAIVADILAINPSIEIKHANYL